MRKLAVVLIISLFTNVDLQAQGCVAIRGASSCGTGMGSSFNLMKGELLAGTSFRYFKSFRHFRGSEEETHRLEQGTEVINSSYFFDLTLSYGITDRLYGNIIIPAVYHSRSSMYEHGGNPPNGIGERHETSSKGLADMRLWMGYWLFDPAANHFNYSLGLGLKLPTGNYNYQDRFYNQGPNRDQDLEKVVDQSIQPGDGGTGFTVETQGFHPINKKITLNSTFYYLFNIKETNGVMTRNGRSEFSCPDQFAARLGVSYVTDKGLSVYMGGRVEGVPANDIIGGSSGYRRPGYVISIEPGLTYVKKMFSFNLNVPLAIVRNRIQSYEDRQRSLQTGNYVHGDAAFADYLISTGIFYRFNSHKKEKPVEWNPTAN